MEAVRMQANQQTILLHAGWYLVHSNTLSGSFLSEIVLSTATHYMIKEDSSLKYFLNFIEKPQMEIYLLPNA